MISQIPIDSLLNLVGLIPSGARYREIMPGGGGGGGGDIVQFSFHSSQFLSVLLSLVDVDHEHSMYDDIFISLCATLSDTLMTKNIEFPS